MKKRLMLRMSDRSIYDFEDDEKDAYRVKAGLTPEIVDQKLSKEKHDPALDAQLFVCNPCKFIMR
ncbi:MAG: hypothetical protein ACLTDC_13215 [Lachnospiraceae bacterium]